MKTRTIFFCKKLWLQKKPVINYSQPAKYKDEPVRYFLKLKYTKSKIN